MRTTTSTGSTLRGLAIAIALVVTTAACGDGDDQDAGADDTAEVEAPADDETDDDAGDTDEAATGDAVTARNINFEPADLTVAAGTTVTFTNEDVVNHTVTAGNPDDIGDAFDEELASEGETTITFDDPGTIDYFCRLHPAMTGTISVE